MTRCPQPSVDAVAGPPSMEDDQRLDQLFQAHAGAVGRFLSAWTRGDQQATNDLVAEAFRRASRVLDRFGVDAAADVRGDVPPWLLTLARRVAVDFNRSRGTGVLGPESENRVTLALTRLSPEYRVLILELFYRSRSVPDTAAMLGVDEATVAARANHALRALRRAMATA